MAIFESIWQDIRYVLRTGNMVNRLALINFIVFVLVNILKFLMVISGFSDSFDTLLHKFCMAAEPGQLLVQPWGIITSIFLHEGFFHVLNNLIFLFLFGKIMGDLAGDRRVLPLYLMGGIMGNFLFFVSGLWMGYEAPYALGASGAVMALAGAVLILAPEYRVMLLFLGEVKVKYIVLVMLLLDMIGIANQNNTGGHIAHLGGFIMGCLFVYNLRDGKDLSEPINRNLDRLAKLFSFNFSRQKTPQMKAKVGGAMSNKGNAKSDNQPGSTYQQKLDSILDKIKQQGYESLTQEEKDFLFDASKR